MNLASREYQEKRNFIRMKVETPFIAKLNLDEGRPIKGTCHNLSGGGMLVSLSEPLELGDKLEVTVSSGHSHSPMLKALTTVRRVDSSKNQDCHLGLEIEEMLE